VSYQPPEIPDEAKKIAKKFFESANTVADTRNYDYAIELFIQGLAKDPQAVELGHKALRGISMKRKMTGGKKAGLLETVKRGGLGKKDTYQAILNSEYFLAKDPFHIGHCEAMVKGLDQADLPEALHWGLGVYLELARTEKQINANRLLIIKSYYEKLGDYYEKNDQPNLAVECFQSALTALEAGIQARVGQNLDFVSIQRDLAGKLTILRGKYNGGGDFRQSIHNADAQKELQDKDRAIKGDDLLAEMIEKGRQELRENPDVAGKINGLADVLLQRGQPADEQEAIDLLGATFDRTKQYAFKLRADDVRIRQMNRAIKELKEKLGQSDDVELKAQIDQAQKNHDEFELMIYQERVRQYPTDVKMKFEYGRRLLKAKRFDEAIPAFQETVGDPRHSILAKNYIGVCFYQKGWNQQAVEILNEAIASYEITGDNLNKEMHYILGRSYENAEQREQALKIYSKLIQWDFNYRDVRQRIDKLQKKS